MRVLFDPDAPYERRLPPWREVIDAPAQVNTVPVNGTRANPARFECGVDAGEIYPVRNLPGAQVFTLGRQEGQPRPPDLLTDTYGLCRCRARRDSNPQPSDPWSGHIVQDRPSRSVPWAFQRGREHEGKLFTP